MKKSKKNPPIPIKDAAHTIGVLESGIKKWINKDNPQLSKDYMGRVCVSEDYVNCCIEKPDYKNAVLELLRAEKTQRFNDETSSESENLKNQRLSLVDDYYKYIKDLENLHSRYLGKVDILNSENALSAAYILFFKVISLLYMTCGCIKVGHWFSGSFLREIDETMDVAHYFIIVEKTPMGKTHLKNWFRANRTPEHSVCRKAISGWETLINPAYSEADCRDVKNELYHKKSKWIHPTLNSIRELIILDESNGKLTVNGFDYAICRYERKLFEYAHFFRSSIWSAYQTFMFCFHDKMPLEQPDKEVIRKYNDLFQRLDAIEW